MQRYDDPKCQALATALHTYGHDRLELEFRLGHSVAGAFVPGVARETWDVLKAALDASSAFEVVVTDTREVISDDGSGSKFVVDMSGKAPAHWMHKKRLWHFDSDTGSTWCCRMAASLEIVDPPGTQPPPPPTGHKFERRKERYSYRYRCWSFDLTKVAGNLPHQLDTDGVVYEVEIELADPTELFARPLPEVVEWGNKLVGDVCRLMTQEAPEWT